MLALHFIAFSSRRIAPVDFRLIMAAKSLGVDHLDGKG
jgi:hypothetical protein